MSRCWMFLLTMAVVSSTGAQTLPTTILPTTAPTTAPVDVPLGKLFESRVSGIQFYPPADGTLVRQVNSGDIVRFIYPQKSWDLHAKMVRTAKPVALSAAPTENEPGGLLEMTADELKATNASAEIQRQQVRDIAQYKVGIISARYNAGASMRMVTHEAIFRSNDRTYYVLQLTTPDIAGNNEGEAAFEKVIHTVKLLDRAELKQEQMERLFRTRELFANWDEKAIKKCLIGEQFLRVIRDGKDAGYIQQWEEIAKRAGNDGYRILQRSHIVNEPEVPAAAPVAPTPQGEVLPVSPITPTTPATPLVPSLTRIDRITDMFVTFDRRSELWTRVSVLDNGQGPPVQSSEMGNSDLEIHRSLAHGPAPINKKDPKEPAMNVAEHYKLSVSYYSKVRTGVPIELNLPPFYLPQALGALMPRLLPLTETRTYMFAYYVNDQKEVMARYVDVLPEQEVDLDGKKVRAVPVTDRIGVEGAATTHYMTRGGEWLGTVNEEQKLMVLPSDRATIQQLWKDAKLDERVEPEPSKVR